MSDRSAHLAIDLGAESGRVVLGVLQADTLEIHEMHRFGHEPLATPDGLRWDVDRLWLGICEGARAAAKWCDGHASCVQTIGVDTWGVDYALMIGDEAEAPYCYRDPRTADVFDRLHQQISDHELYRSTGIQPMAINTLFQLAAHAQNDPDIVHRATHLLFVPDYFHARLSGKRVNEATIASTSQMVRSDALAWSESLLERAGVFGHMLGELVRPATRLGELICARELGLSESTEVVLPASHDTASAVAAVPAEADSNWCYLSSGTWSLMGAEIDRPVLTDEARRAPFTNERGLQGTRFHKNISGLWLVQECKRDLAELGHHYEYQELAELASRAPAFTTILDPAHDPFAKPGSMVQRVKDFADATGQPRPIDHGTLIRICLEALALEYARTLEQLERILDRRFEVIHVVGGGSKNRLLNQMAADATGRPVVAGPAEATAIGNLLVQALGMGRVESPNHLRRIVRSSFKTERFESNNPEAWTEARARFEQLRGAVL